VIGGYELFIDFLFRRFDKWLAKFRGLMETMKTAKIRIQQIKTNLQYKAWDTNTRSQLTRISNTIVMELGNLHLKIRVMLMVLNATFNNISVISWRSILLVEETGGPEENHRPTQITDKLSHMMLYSSTSRLERDSNS
jgi:hypothetical protein